MKTFVRKRERKKRKRKTCRQIKRYDHTTRLKGRRIKERKNKERRGRQRERNSLFMRVVKKGKMLFHIYLLF